MAVPLIAAAGVGIVSALGGAVAQAINNARTSKAEKQEIEKLERLAKEIEKPNFSVENIEPSLIDSVFEYNPESVPFIAEVAPQIVEKSPVAQQAQQAQMGALGRFEELAQTGEDAQLIAAREGAERESMEALSRAQAEREAMSQRRGLGLGSGAQLALQQADLSATAQRQQEMNEQAAADAALRRMQASQTAASLGGQITGQELALAGQNVGIINAFNQRQAMREQGIAAQNIAAQNAAQLMAAQQQQDLAAQNAAIQNQLAEQNRQAQMQAKQQQFGAEMDIYGARAGLGRERMGQVGRQSERTARTISGVSQAVGGAAKGIGSMMGGS